MQHLEDKIEDSNYEGGPTVQELGKRLQRLQQLQKHMEELNVSPKLQRKKKKKDKLAQSQQEEKKKHQLTQSQQEEKEKVGKSSQKEEDGMVERVNKVGGLLQKHAEEDSEKTGSKVVHLEVPADLPPLEDEYVPGIPGAYVALSEGSESACPWGAGGWSWAEPAEEEAPGEEEAAGGEEERGQVHLEITLDDPALGTEVCPPGKRPCQYWLRGWCHNGGACSWWHQKGQQGSRPIPPKNEIPCTFFFKFGHCNPNHKKSRGPGGVGLSAFRGTVIAKSYNIVSIVTTCCQ